MHQAVPDQAADVPAVRRAEEHEAAGGAAVPDSQQRSGLWSGHIRDPEPAFQVLLDRYQRLRLRVQTGVLNFTLQERFTC